MKALDQSAVPHWIHDAGHWRPATVDCECPFCQRHVNFPLEKALFDSNRKAFSFSAPCPACRQTAYVWTIGPAPATDAENKTAACLAIFPAPAGSREPIQSVDRIPRDLARAYLDALEVYRAGVWNGAVTLCRRTLEGVVIERLGNSASGPLAQMLRELGASPDLGKPIVSLANSVRLGGNLGAHYQLGKEADEQIATAMLDLLEYLLEYFYTIPSLIEGAKALLDSPQAAPPPQSGAGAT